MPKNDATVGLLLSLAALIVALPLSVIAFDWCFYLMDLPSTTLFFLGYVTVIVVIFAWGIFIWRMTKKWLKKYYSWLQ